MVNKKLEKDGKGVVDTKRLKDLKHKARRRSIKEGIFTSVTSAFGDTYISPFAIAINASNSMVAMLTSISGLLGPLSQTFSSKLIEKNTRKRIVLYSVFLELLMWIPFIILGVLFYLGIYLNFLPIFLLLFFSLYTIFSNASSPAWFSWMGDIVDPEFRGRWFAKRSLITGFVGGILAVGASFFLDYCKNINFLMPGFFILFFLALIARITAWTILKRQYEPKIKLKKGYYFSFYDFVKRAPKTNFGKFAIFRAFFTLANAISASIIAIYLLRNLNLNYTWYIAISLAGGIFSLVFVELWGKFADHYGNYRIIYITSYVIILIPILWMISSSPWYLFLVPSLVTGIGWAGFNLASGNFIYDSVRPEKRGLVISYYNMLNGIGTFIGAGIGALLITYVEISLVSTVMIIFAISAVARLLAVLWLIPKIKEIRKTETFNGKKALKNLIFKDTASTLTEEAHEIMTMHRYIEED